MEYFKHPYTSNSDLTKSKGGGGNPEAFRLGTLFHTVTLEPEKLNPIKGTIEGLDYSYTRAEIDHAKRMRVAVMSDSFCNSLIKSCSKEVEMFNANTLFNYDGYAFAIDTKRKYDLWNYVTRWGGDLKSTSATTELEFMEAIGTFDYDRARVFYAKGSGAKQDVIIGVSKVNMKVFKVFMREGCPLWQRGEQKLNALAFDFWKNNCPF